VKPWKAPGPSKVYKAVGCLDCRNTGYRGRQGIYEILPLSETIKEMLNEKTELSVLRKQAMKEGMRTLRLAGAQKIAAGVTTIEEVLRVAPPPSTYS